MPDRLALRTLCGDTRAGIARTPLLSLVAVRVIDHHADADTTFYERWRALKRLADALHLEHAACDIRVCARCTAEAGEGILHGDELDCQVSISGFGPGEILFRHCRGLSDHVGERDHRPCITELVDHSRLAARIAREIGLACAPESQPRLVA